MVVGGVAFLILALSATWQFCVPIAPGSGYGDPKKGQNPKIGLQEVFVPSNLIKGPLALGSICSHFSFWHSLALWASSQWTLTFLAV